jgi:hypothetical protein
MEIIRYFPDCVVPHPKIPPQNVSSLLDMTQGEVRKTLRGQGFTPDELQSIIHWHRVNRQAVQNNGKMHGNVRNLWGGLIKPLVAELQRVRVSKSRTVKDPTPHRDRAYAYYYDLLTETLRDFEKLSISGRTPVEVADKLRLKNILVVKNDRTHWTDWIADEDRAAAIELFDAIPPSKGARTKELFARTLPKDLNRKLKARMERKLTKELDAERAAHSINPNDEKRKQRLIAMHKALEKLKNLSDDANIPRKWTELAKEELI